MFVQLIFTYFTFPNYCFTILQKAVYIETKSLGLNGVDCTTEISITKGFNWNIFFIDNPTKCFSVQNICTHVYMSYLLRKIWNTWWSDTYCTFLQYNYHVQYKLKCIQLAKCMYNVFLIELNSLKGIWQHI